MFLLNRIVLHMYRETVAVCALHLQKQHDIITYALPLQKTRMQLLIYSQI